MHDDSFVKLEALLRSQTDPIACSRAIDRFMKTLQYPVLEDETTAVLLYQGPERGVMLIGDMTDWVETVPMLNIPGTDLFFYRGKFETDARLEYALQPEGQPGPAADPLNPYGVQGFFIYSELAMPGYVRNPIFDPWRDGRKAGYDRVRKEIVPRGALPYPHDIHIYLPPGYEAATQTFPVVYFNDGSAYIENGAAPAVFDALIQSGRIEPMIGVFVTPPNVGEPKTPNRITEYGMNDDYVRFFSDELVPFIDGRLRTRRSPSARLIVGASYGGLISAYIGFVRTDVFGLAYSQSGYMSFQNDRLMREMEAKGSAGARLYVDIGTYERRVARGIVIDTEGDFLLANRRCHETLRRLGADAVYREYHEGHTWGNWRAHLLDALEHFFGKRV
jgi:enterochelin esterase family protein